MKMILWFSAAILIIAELLSTLTLANDGTFHLEQGIKTTKYDLSTPEKTINIYIEAFRTGNDGLRQAALASRAQEPEFNPTQTIVKPDPSIIGPQIVKKRIINERRLFAEPNFYTEPLDIEVYVNIKRDPKHYWTRALDHRIFLLRKFGNDWKIIGQAPFWPEEEIIP